MENANFSLTLLFICQPFVLLIYVYISRLLVINCKCGYRKKARRLPLRRKFGNYFVNIPILVLVYVEYCQSGSLIVLRRSEGFLSPFMPLKLPSAAQVTMGRLAKRHISLDRTGALRHQGSGRPELWFHFFHFYFITFFA